MSARLSVCHRCQMIGSEAEGRAHEIARGHEVEVLTEEQSAAVREEQDHLRAERVVGLMQLAQLQTQRETTDRGGTDGDE